MKACESAVPSYLTVGDEPRMFNMHDAKSNLSRLVDEAAAGKEIIIAKAGKPAARLVALESAEKAPERQLGLARGKFSVPDDFDDPLPPEIWGSVFADE